MLAALLNSDKSRSRTQETPEDLLQAAFEQVMAFSPRKVEQLALPTETILDLAQKESAFGRISVDSHGLTQGMRVHLGQPARNFMQEWPYIRAPFDTAVLPLQHNAEAMGRISAEIEDLQAVCDKKKAAIEAQAKGDQKYVGVHDAYTEKKREYERLKEGESRREAVVFAYSPYYKLLLLLMFIAEWLINYDTLLTFLGVKAMAMGGTFVLGYLLARAADGHGTILRQYSHLRHMAEGENHATTWRMLALSTFSFLIVLAAAGGMRYAYVMQRAATAGTGEVGFLIPGAEIDISPVRDVLISLLCNVAAWASGVFLSYFSHDSNPKYMEAAYEFHRAKRAYEKAREKYDEKIIIEEAKIEKEIERIKNTAQGKVSYAREKRYDDFVGKVKAHDEIIRKSVLDRLSRNVEFYRDTLTQLVLQNDGAVQFVRGDTQLTPHEYREIMLAIDALL